MYLTLVPGSRRCNGVGVADSNEVGRAPHTLEKSKGGELKTGTYIYIVNFVMYVCVYIC